MAKNLLAKMPKSETLVISDLNVKATKDFVKEMGNGTCIEVAESVREVAEKCVSVLFKPSMLCLFLYDEYVLSMI